MSKKKSTKTRARESRGEDSNEENRSERNQKHDTGKKGERVPAKPVKDHKEPSMALLKAYEVSGHLDRRRRITVSAFPLNPYWFEAKRLFGKIAVTYNQESVGPVWKRDSLGTDKQNIQGN